MTAKIVDLVGANIDAKAKELIGILCRDYELTANHAQAVHAHAESWELLSEAVADKIKESMQLVGLRYFETETLLITLIGDDLEIEGRAAKCSPH